jgi:hypothetical protein
MGKRLQMASESWSYVSKKLLSFADKKNQPNADGRKEKKMQRFLRSVSIRLLLLSYFGWGAVLFRYGFVKRVPRSW